MYLLTANRAGWPVIILQSFLEPHQLELLKVCCERARLEQQQEITTRLNVQLAEDPVSCSGFGYTSCLL